MQALRYALGREGETLNVVPDHIRMLDEWLGIEYTVSMERGVTKHIYDNIFQQRRFYGMTHDKPSLYVMYNIIIYYWKAMFSDEFVTLFREFPVDKRTELNTNVLSLLRFIPVNNFDNPLLIMMGIEYGLRLRDAIDNPLSDLQGWLRLAQQFLGPDHLKATLNDTFILIGFRYVAQFIPMFRDITLVPERCRVQLGSAAPFALDACDHDRLPLRDTYTGRAQSPPMISKVQVNPQNVQLEVPLYHLDDLKSLRTRIAAALGAPVELILMLRESSLPVSRTTFNQLTLHRLKSSQDSDTKLKKVTVLDLRELVEQVAQVLKANQRSIVLILPNYLKDKRIEQATNLMDNEWLQLNELAYNTVLDLIRDTVTSFFDNKAVPGIIENTVLKYAVPKAFGGAKKDPADFWVLDKLPFMVSFKKLQKMFRSLPRFDLDTLRKDDETMQYRLGLMYSMLQNKPFKTTAVKYRSYSLECTFTLDNYDIYTLFDSMKVDANAPLCFIDNSFVKVLNRLIVPEEWFKVADDEEDEETSEEALHLYLNVRSDEVLIEDERLVQPVQFTRALIKQTSSKIFVLTIELDQKSDEDMLIYRVSALLPMVKDLYVRRKFKSAVLGAKMLQYSNTSVIDTFLNDILSNSVAKPSMRSRVQRAFDRVQLRLSIKESSLELTMRHMSDYQKIDETIRQESKQDTLPTTVFLIVNDKGLDVSFHDVQVGVLRLLACISNMVQSLPVLEFDYYCVLSNNFKSIIESTTKPVIDRSVLAGGSTSAQNVAPDVVRPMYNDICPAEKIPTFVPLQNPDDVTAAGSAYQMTEQSFREANPTTNYIVYPPSSQSRERRYMVYCPNEEYPHLNLRRNCIMDNHKTHPFVPCCYEKQASGEKQIIDVYMRHLDDPSFNLQSLVDVQAKATKTTQSKKPLESNKVLDPNILGYLPRDVTLLLTLSSPEAVTGDLKFLRCGAPMTFDSVTSGNWRVLSALQMATKRSPSIAALKQLVQQGLMSSTLQARYLSEAYALQVLDNQEFVDPRLWLPVLREAFGVDIVLFGVNEDNQKTLLVEYFDKERVVLSRFYEVTVLLYMNEGSRFDCAETAQAEVVVSAKNNKVDKMLHKTNSNLVQKLNELLLKMYSTRVVPSLDPALVYTMQSIDTAGYTRSVTKGNISMVTQPRPNVKASSTKTSMVELRGAPLQVALGLVTDPRLVLYNQNVVGVTNVEQTKFFKVFPEVPYEGQAPPLDSTFTDYVINPAEYQVDYAEKYYWYKRIVNFVTSYVLWTASNDLVDMTKDAVEQWFQNRVSMSLVDSDAFYNQDELKSRMFRRDNPSIFDSDGKLVVRAMSQKQYDSIIYRLKFAVMKMINLNPEDFQQYKTLKYVPDFYSTSVEFDESNEFSVYNNPKEYMVACSSYSKLYQVAASVTERDQSYFVRLALPKSIDNLEVTEKQTKLAARFDSLLEALQAFASLQESNTLYNEEVFPQENQAFVLIEGSAKMRLTVPRTGLRSVAVTDMMVVVKLSETSYYGLYPVPK